MIGNMGCEEEICLDAGMNDFIAKLFDPLQIEECFSKFLQLRDSRN